MALALAQHGSNDVNLEGVRRLALAARKTMWIAVVSFPQPERAPAARGDP